MNLAPFFLPRIAKWTYLCRNQTGQVLRYSIIAFLAAVSLASVAAISRTEYLEQKHNPDAPLLYNTARLQINTVISHYTSLKTLSALAGDRDHNIAFASTMMLAFRESKVDHGTAAKITKLTYVTMVNDPKNSIAANALLNIVTDTETPQRALAVLRHTASPSIREAADLMLSLREAGIDNRLAEKIVKLSDSAKYGGQIEDTKSIEELLLIVTNPVIDKKLLAILSQKPSLVQRDARRMFRYRSKKVDHALASRVVLLLNRSLRSSSYEEYRETIGGLLSIINDPKTPAAILEEINKSDAYRVRLLAASVLSRRITR